MEIDLRKLLSRRPIIHPTRILSVTDTEGSIQMALSGCPWWRDDHIGLDAAYRFRFNQVSHGHLSVTGVWNTDWDEDLEDFRIGPLQDASWAPKSWQIFCSEPLRSSIDLYARLEKFLADSDSFLRPWDFLNCNADRPVGSFAELAQSHSYLLAQCPEGIGELLVQELNRQNVKHNVIDSKDTAPTAPLRVRFSGSDFLCASATAILPDDKA